MVAHLSPLDLQSEVGFWTFGAMVSARLPVEALGLRGSQGLSFRGPRSSKSYKLRAG